MRAEIDLLSRGHTIGWETILCRRLLVLPLGIGRIPESLLTMCLIVLSCARVVMIVRWLVISSVLKYGVRCHKEGAGLVRLWYRWLEA